MSATMAAVGSATVVAVYFIYNVLTPTIVLHTNTSYALSLNDSLVLTPEACRCTYLDITLPKAQ